jgi:tetratricopeptide (TPR) repeat protein
VLWQRARYHAAEAERHAAEFKEQWEIAQRQRERAEGHLGNVMKKADSLTRLGYDLSLRPGMSDAGKAVLEQALSFYEQLVPEERSDPKVCLQAAQLYGRLANIHHTLGQWEKAVAAFSQEATLLSTVLAQEGPNPAYRHQLAVSHRSRGNALRDVGRLREAREAYQHAAELHEQFVNELPEDAGNKVALANTLLNQAAVVADVEEAESLERLYKRVVELYRAASNSAPKNRWYKAELALGLEAQGVYFLSIGRNTQALSLIQESLTIRQELLGPGNRSRPERYLARNYAHLGRAQAAAGQMGQAERSYREGMKLLEQLVKDSPWTPFHRLDLAETMTSLADLLDNCHRQAEAEKIRRSAVSHYETLITNFPEQVHNFVALANVLWEFGRYTEAIGLFRKALQRDPDSLLAINSLAWALATNPELSSPNVAEAVRLAQKAVTARPRHANFWNTLGAAHYRNGEYKAAITALESAMRLHQGGDGLDWIFLAMANGRLGAGAEARKWFDRAVQWMDEHKPHDSELRRFRA